MIWVAGAVAIDIVCWVADMRCEIIGIFGAEPDVGVDGRDGL